LDDYELTRSPAGAHIGWEEPAVVAQLQRRNESEFDTIVCRSPKLSEALGLHDHRAVVRPVSVQVTVNGDLYGRAHVNFSYYHL
jgi:hypothetical protein